MIEQHINDYLYVSEYNHPTTAKPDLASQPGLVRREGKAKLFMLVETRETCEET